MIRSMTGYGRGEIGQFSVEIKSVNSRNCVIIAKLPDVLSAIEPQVVAYVRSMIKRGQINVSVMMNKDGTSSGKKAIIDKQLAKEYWQHLQEIKEYLSISDPISLDDIANLPGVIALEETRENIEKIWPDLQVVLEKAINQLIDMRKSEGTAMLEDITKRLEVLSQIVEHISIKTPEVVEKYRDYINKRITELLQDQAKIDESRMAMEVALMAEKSDITEEIVRLRSHISQIMDDLKNPKEPVGRHLDFVLQEMNREINTVSSKADDYEIISDCIKFKDEIEKIREQVQNIE